MVRHRAWWLIATSSLVPSCEPALTDTTSIVASPRVLAVQATPAEAKPGDSVTLRALVARPSDGSAAPAPSWAFCLDRLPLTDLDSVAASCVGADGDFAYVGAGEGAVGALPDDACRLFGPAPPDPVAGQPPGRPVDPDGTGGYYQPVGVIVSQRETISAVRLACGLANARQSDAQTFAAHYRRNENPSVASLSVDGAAVPLDDSAVVKVAAGAHVPLSLAWPACPRAPSCGDGVCSPEETDDDCPADCATPHGCGGEETYLAYDDVGLRIAVRREGMHVAWYATAGTFDEPRAGNAETDPETTTSVDGWTAPATSTEARLWVVLRDDRGGSGWATANVHVTP